MGSVLINGSAQRNVETFTLNQITDVTHNLSSIYYWVMYQASALLIQNTEVKNSYSLFICQARSQKLERIPLSSIRYWRSIIRANYFGIGNSQAHTASFCLFVCQGLFVCEALSCDLFEPITLIDSESESATVWTVLIELFLAHSDLWRKSSEGPPSVWVNVQGGKLWIDTSSWHVACTLLSHAKRNQERTSMNNW